jgi:hypothetical protein
MKRRPVAIIAPHSGSGGCAPRPEEAEAGRGQDDAGHVERDAHDQRGRHSGMTWRSTMRHGRRALQPHRGDVVALRMVSVSARAMRA